MHAYTYSCILTLVDVIRDVIVDKAFFYRKRTLQIPGGSAFPTYLLGGANVYARLIHDSYVYSTHYPERLLDRFSRFCTVDAAFSLYAVLRRTLRPNKKSLYCDLFSLFGALLGRCRQITSRIKLQ